MEKTLRVGKYNSGKATQFYIIIGKMNAKGGVVERTPWQLNPANNLKQI